MYGHDKITGERKIINLDRDISNVLALNRIALGFPVTTHGLMPWMAHPGYSTGEGRELNETAIEAGDNPEDWYVAENPIDILLATEVWSSASMLKPKLKRQDGYLKDVHRMVKMCRETKGIYIPPTWLTPTEARELAKTLNLPIGSLD